MRPPYMQTTMGLLAVLLAAGPAFAAGAQNSTDTGGSHRGSWVSTTVPDTSDEYVASGTYAMNGNRYGLQIYTGSNDYIAEAGIARYKPSSSVVTDYYVSWIGSDGVWYYSAVASGNPGTGTALEFGIYHNGLTKWAYEIWEGGSLERSGSVTTQHSSMRVSRASIISDNGSKTKVSGYSHRFWDANYYNSGSGWLPWPNSSNSSWGDGYGVWGSATGSFLSGGNVYLMTY